MMQSDVIHQTAALSHILTAPKTEVPAADYSTPRTEMQSGSKKSFDDMIDEARCSKPVPPEEKTVSEGGKNAAQNIGYRESEQSEQNERPVAAAEKKSGKNKPDFKTVQSAGKKQLSADKEQSFVPEKSDSGAESVLIRDGGKKIAAKLQNSAVRKSVSETEKDSRGAENASDSEKTTVQSEIDISAERALLSGLPVRPPEQETRPLQTGSDAAEIIFDNLDTIDDISSAAKTPRRFSLDKDGKIIVSDFRSEKTPEISEDAGEKQAGLKVSDVKYDRNTAEMTVELTNAESARMNMLSSNSQAASANGSQFQAMLTNQIQQSAPEIVKAGSVILKDNDSGQIKLVLNPESLGNVKIDLHISEKSITGRIVVASQEAYNAFKESADSLRQAFIHSGFESAGFDVSYSGQNSFSGQGERHQNTDAPRNAAHTYGEFIAGSDSGFSSEENYAFSERNSVNIVA